MPGYMTDEEAAKYRCPIARTFPDGKAATCDGSKCLLWRMKPVKASDQLFMSAVKREEACLALAVNEGKEPHRYHKQAVQNVAADLEGFGVVNDRGVCGLGGQP